nr:hypothetical protein Q903MT_gene6042 [Picea sitchensis]
MGVHPIYFFIFLKKQFIDKMPLSNPSSRSACLLEVCVQQMCACRAAVSYPF